MDSIMNILEGIKSRKNNKKNIKVNKLRHLVAKLKNSTTFPRQLNLINFYFILTNATENGKKNFTVVMINDCKFPIRLESTLDSLYAILMMRNTGNLLALDLHSNQYFIVKQWMYCIGTTVIFCLLGLKTLILNDCLLIKIVFLYYAIAYHLIKSHPLLLVVSLCKKNRIFYDSPTIFETCQYIISAYRLASEVGKAFSASIFTIWLIIECHWSIKYCITLLPTSGCSVIVTQR
ncbi:hypothetical protein AGLY_010739 [Aphis glycines]|uniref:Uncharacterized protein n=1 Tax=Aphis glycines TaxID=307491 RepID=A0A6G0TGM6_APHGL|nr:hypothetical protein AGLY_010739 [Aphis glycines]